MAETITGESIGGHYGEGTITGQTLANAASQAIKTFAIPRGARRLFLEIKNSGSLAFDQFDIQRRPHESAAWETVATSAGDYSSPAVPLLEVQGAPVTLGAGLSAFIRMDVEAAESVRLLGSAAPPFTTIDLHYRLQ